MSDPTYVVDEINADPEWQLAFLLSELRNDNAPIGWSRYISEARAILQYYERKPEPKQHAPEPVSRLPE